MKTTIQSGYSLQLSYRAAEHDSTDQTLLWTKLNKNKILGLQFRRQHPINMFIADFFCAQVNLVIEINGNIHEIQENQEHDSGRTDMLNEFGINVIRFTNEQVINEIDYTIIQIEEAVQKLLKEKASNLTFGAIRG